MDVRLSPYGMAVCFCMGQMSVSVRDDFLSVYGTDVCLSLDGTAFCLSLYATAFCLFLDATVICLSLCNWYWTDVCLCMGWLSVYARDGCVSVENILHDK